MKKISWTLAFTIFLLGNLTGQQFSFHSEKPFGIEPILEDTSRQALRIMFSDIDGDEDYDIILTGLDFIELVDPMTWEHVHYFIEVQENTGDKWNPSFGERKPLSDDFPFPAGYVLPSAGDINGDGQTDFLILGIVDEVGNRTLVYCRKNPQGSTDDFQSIRMDEMGLNDFVPGSTFMPTLVDLDLDGDLDILMSGLDPPFSNEETDPYPVFYYAKNTGTPTVPNFVGWFANPYGLVSNPLMELMTATGDVDNDGDIDLLGTMGNIPADSMNHFYVHLNSPGPNGKPAFGPAVPSPYGLPSGHGTEQYLFPELVDIDGDSDLDLFVFRSQNAEFFFEYFENTASSAAPDINSEALQISLYPNPTEGLFYILNETSYELEKLIISDKSGQEVMVKTLNGKMQVDLSSLVKGVYMVRMTGKGFDVIRKIVIM